MLKHELQPFPTVFLPVLHVPPHSSLKPSIPPIRLYITVLLCVVVGSAPFLCLAREASRAYKRVSGVYCTQKNETVTSSLLICQLLLTSPIEICSREINMSEPWQAGRSTGRKVRHPVSSDGVFLGNNGSVRED